MSSLAANLPLYGARRSMFGARAMLSQSRIPMIDVSSLFAGDGADRTAHRCGDPGRRGGAGFFSGTQFSARPCRSDRASRSELLRLFDLPEHEIRPLWRKKFDASHANVYRGLVSAAGGISHQQGRHRSGPGRRLRSLRRVRAMIPCARRHRCPASDALPGWREAAAHYYLGMVETSQALMRSIARSLHLAEHFFDDAFDRDSRRCG